MNLWAFDLHDDEKMTQILKIQNCVFKYCKIGIIVMNDCDEIFKIGVLEASKLYLIERLKFTEWENYKLIEIFVWF